MVRGKLDPMWTVALSVPVPSFSVGRQEHAEAEASARREAASRSLEVMTQALTLATHQRAASLVSLRLVAERFEGNDGLLAQSTAAAESMVTAFGSGRVTLSAALDVQREALDEIESSLALRAEAWRLVIAQDELGVSP
jgi:outer membrane protein TolC